MEKAQLIFIISTDVGNPLAFYNQKSLMDNTLPRITDIIEGRKKNHKKKII